MNKFLVTLLVLILSGCSSFGLFKTNPEVHAIGVYEGTDPEDDDRPWHAKCESQDMLSCHRKMTQRKRDVAGQVVINVSITERPLILAFTAYDKTNWIVKAEEGVVIERVILGGYHAQSIEGVPKETSIEVYTYDSSPCPRCYQGNEYFYSYKSVPPQLSKITGLPVESWQGKYRGQEFSIFTGIKESSGSK